MNQFNHMNRIRPVLINRDSPQFQGFPSPPQSMPVRLNGQLLNQQTLQQQTIQLNSLNDSICLENFICPSHAKQPNKVYCNACCVDLPLTALDEHLRTSKHFNNRKKLNNQLLAVNLFQISKHYSHELMVSLNRSFVNQSAFTSVKLLDYHEFEDFLNANLSVKFKLTLHGSIPNEVAIKQSDINVNIELLGEKDENNRDILKLTKQLVQEKASHKFEVLNVPNLDRHERAYFMTKNRNLINLINIENLKHSRLIGQYVQFDRRVPVLMYNLRLWANFCELDQPLKASYRPQLIQIMVIYFLQHCNLPVLPNFHQELKKSDDFVYGENEIKHHPIEPIKPEEIEQLKATWTSKNTQTVGELWIDFFKFYLFLFDHEKTYVNIVHRCKEKTSKAFSVCNLIDGSVFSVIFNWRLHYDRLNRLLFDMYKHSCFFSYPTHINNDNLDIYFKFIFSPQNFKRNIDFKLTKKNGENKGKQQKVQFDLYQLWRLSVKFNFKVCIKQELDKLTKHKFNLKINQQAAYQDLPRYCVLCKSKDHFVKDCKNMNLPELQPIDEEKARNCAAVLDLVADHYFKHKSVNENRAILQAIDEIKNTLNRSIQTFYPNSKLELYGSILNGFGHLESDLDFALLFEPPEPENSSLCHRAVVKRIGNSSIRKMRQVEDLQIIVNARVPIIKLKYRTRSHVYDCDISIENRLAFCNTHLLRCYCIIDNRVAKLGLLIKRFAKLCQICFANQGGMKSYAFNIMIIYFLQHCDPPVLPCLHELDEENQGEGEKIDGWQVRFFNDLDRLQQVWPGWKQNNQTVGQLLIDFFVFYTEKFNFDKDVITIRQSGRLTKFEKNWTSIIAVEDPFLLTHNLSDALEMSMVNYIKSCFIKARNHFTSFVTKGYHNGLRLVDVLQMIFDLGALKGDASMPSGRGCQICFKIGHKKANCPDRNIQQEKKNTHLPMEFNLSINDLSTKNSQYRELVSLLGSEILKFRTDFSH